MRKTLKTRWKKLTLRKKIFFILGSIIVIFFVHDLLELMFLAHPTETLIYRIREERYDPPLKTRIEAVTEDISTEPAAIVAVSIAVASLGKTGILSCLHSKIVGTCFYQQEKYDFFSGNGRSSKLRNQNGTRPEKNLRSGNLETD